MAAKRKAHSHRRSKPGERIARVRDFRDAALRWLEREGRWEIIGPTRVRRLESPPFTMIHRTPEFPLPRAVFLGDEASPEEVARLENEYGLDVWVAKTGKVLNIAWQEGEPIEIRACKRGAWEERLLRACG
jgi:hypothetical protein